MTGKDMETSERLAMDVMAERVSSDTYWVNHNFIIQIFLICLLSVFLTTLPAELSFTINEKTRI